MIISFKMVDGSRYDVPANQYQKEKLFQDLSKDDGIAWHWWQICDEHEKLVILNTSNIVSITLKGDADDGKGIS